MIKLISIISAIVLFTLSILSIILWKIGSKNAKKGLRMRFDYVIFDGGTKSIASRARNTSRHLKIMNDIQEAGGEIKSIGLVKDDITIELSNGKSKYWRLRKMAEML